MNIKLLRSLLFTFLVIGCSAKYGQLSPSDELALLQRMAAGRAVLDCQVSCAGRWGAERRTLKRFHDTLQWEALALNVMEIGFNDDLAWYYLGRSAEGLGYPDAARLYYERALSAGYPCNSALFNNCDGFVFPADAQHRLELLAAAHKQGPENAAARSLPPGSVPAEAGGPKAGQTIVSTGSGFFINDRGTLVTNAHVVSGCTSVHIAGSGPPLTVAQVDSASDIALLSGPPNSHFLTLREGKPIRAGDSVVAIGFPLKGLLAPEANVTTGTVSALAGLLNDPAMLQITAPVQAGNSGGPLIDEGGNVVGVVVGKLDAVKVALKIGDLPQNINFALKAGKVRELLDRANLPYRMAISSDHLSAGDIGERAKPAVVALECWQ